MIPSLLFQDPGFANNDHLKHIVSGISVTKDISKEILENIPSSKSSEKVSEIMIDSKSTITDKENTVQENKIDDLLNKLREKKDALVSLQEVVSGYEEKLQKVLILTPF